MSIESAFWVRQNISRDIFYLFIYLNLGLPINIPVEVSSTELNRCGKEYCMPMLIHTLTVHFIRNTLNVQSVWGQCNA